MTDKRHDNKFNKSEAEHKWCHTEFFYQPSLPVTDAQVSEIAAHLYVSEDSDYVGAVVAAIRRCHGREIAIAQLPPGDHRIRDIATLNALAQAMGGLNSNILARLAKHGVDASSFDGNHVAAVASLVIEELQREIPKPKRGAKPKVSRNITFRELTEVYKNATGKNSSINYSSETRQTTGGQPTCPFFLYMRAAMTPVPELSKLTDQALASAVRRAIIPMVK